MSGGELVQVSRETRGELLQFLRSTFKHPGLTVERQQQAERLYVALSTPAPASSEGGSGAREVLDTKFQCDLGDVTMREYFAALLTKLLEQEEMFSSKRPFGNSEWKWELYYPLWEAGLVEAEEDEFGFGIEPEEERKGDVLLAQLVRRALGLGAQP